MDSSPSLSLPFLLLLPRAQGVAIALVALSPSNLQKRVDLSIVLFRHLSYVPIEFIVEPRLDRTRAYILGLGVEGLGA